MQNRRTETSPRYLVGLARGSLVLIFFGTLWAGLSLPGLRDWGLWTVIVIAGVMTVALLVPSFTTLRAAQSLHLEKMTPEEQASGKKVARRFGLVVGVEWTVAIVAANVLLILFNHPEFIAPVLVLIIGLHFLPLAPLFQVRVYSLVGTVLSLLGGGALLALLFGLPLSGLYTWSVIVGLGTACILWLTSLYILVRARRLLSLIQQTPEGIAGIRDN